jgi:V-type H+-transporting ATPase subunit a
LIVNTYGVPSYQEINPAVFTSVTFPFLFGVMFGDIGHGLLLLIPSVCLMWAGHRAWARPFFPYRYMLVTMGIFSFYCGLLYNDFFSISLNLFGSCYENGVRKTSECVYPFGNDPAWSISSFEIQQLNSLKMKMSVIIGVLHMLLGIVLKGCNSVYFKEWTDLVFLVIP